jgi:hypothetical protein
MYMAKTEAVSVVIAGVNLPYSKRSHTMGSAKITPPIAEIPSKKASNQKALPRLL